MEFHPIFYLYSILQWILDKLLSPIPPPPHAQLHRPRIAVIGAGLTGVSSASHCVGHGFDVTIFEAGNEKSLGGIWAVSQHSLIHLESADRRLRKSTTPPASRFIASCIASILPSIGALATQIVNKSSPRSPSYGNGMVYKNVLNSIPV